MPPVTLTTVVDLTKIKMKWKEIYVSEGLNRKVIPGSPKGIYSGLKLIQNITSPRLVGVSAGVDVVHAAVHQSAVGYSTTYYDNAGTAIVLNLDSVSLDNQETVITLSITYVIGADTVASWIAYPIADWNALTDAQRAERIVLGTVNVPAAATNITTAMILPNRRTVAWENEAPGSIQWSPIIKNPSFEHGVTASLVKYAISDWESPTLTWSVGHTLRLGATTVRSGAKSLEFNKTALGAGSCSIEQHQEIPVVPGQYINVIGWVRQLIAPTAGSYTFDLYWGDLNSTATTSTSVTASVLATTDAGFRRVSQIVEVPAATYVLKKTRIQITGVVTASTGIALVVDDFQVYVEAGSPLAVSAAANSRLKQQLVSALVVEDPSTYALGQLAAMALFDKSTPASEGRLLLERRDQDYSGANLPPALEVLGRAFLGANLVSTETKALLARITAPVSTAGGVEFTLMWLSAGTGLTSVRMYANSTTGVMVWTNNASYDGTNWIKDINGQEAFKIELSRSQFGVFRQIAGTNTWADGAWLTPLGVTSTGLVLEANSHVTVSGTGAYKHGNMELVLTAVDFVRANGTGTISHNGSGRPKYLSGGAGDVLYARIDLPIGKRIKGITVYNKRSSGTITIEAYDSNMTADSAALVGDSMAVSAGTSLVGTAITTWVNTAVVSGHAMQIYVALGAVSNEIYGAVVTFDHI